MSQGNALTTVLVTCYLGDDLCCDIAGSGKTIRLINKGTADNSAIHKHVFQIYKVTVVHMLNEIVFIMKMNDTKTMCFHDMFWKKLSFCKVTAGFTCNVVTLYAVDSSCFVGIFLFDLGDLVIILGCQVISSGKL